MNVVAITPTWKVEHKCANDQMIIVERQAKTTVDDNGHKNETIFALTLRGTFVRDGASKIREYRQSLSPQEMQQIKTASVHVDDLMRDRRYQFGFGTVFSSRVNDWLSVGFVARSRNEGTDFLDVVINENHARFEAEPGLLASFDQR